MKVYVVREEITHELDARMRFDGKVSYKAHSALAGEIDRYDEYYREAAQREHG